MTSTQFLDSMREHYTVTGQPLYGNFHFNKWLLKRDGTYSFQFNLLKQRKAIPQEWLIKAKDALNQGVNVDRYWFNDRFGQKHNHDCRASVALWLLNHCE